MFLSFPMNHIFKPRVELFYLLLAKNQNTRIPWKLNEHGIAFISCISYIPCITGIQDRGSLIQTWYSHQTQRFDLFLLCAQRSVMKKLCGVTKRKAHLGFIYEDVSYAHLLPCLLYLQLVKLHTVGMSTYSLLDDDDTRCEFYSGVM